MIKLLGPLALIHVLTLNFLFQEVLELDQGIRLPASDQTTEETQEALPLEKVQASLEEGRKIRNELKQSDKDQREKLLERWQENLVKLDLIFQEDDWEEELVDQYKSLKESDEIIQVLTHKEEKKVEKPKKNTFSDFLKVMAKMEEQKLQAEYIYQKALVGHRVNSLYCQQALNRTLNLPPLQNFFSDYTSFTRPQQQPPWNGWSNPASYIYTGPGQHFPALNLASTIPSVVINNYYLNRNSAFPDLAITRLESPTRQGQLQENFPGTQAADSFVLPLQANDAQLSYEELLQLQNRMNQVDTFPVPLEGQLLNQPGFLI